MFDNVSLTRSCDLLQASQEDELSLVEGECLNILDHGAGDGWLRV